jgi:hypothetical protein
LITGASATDANTLISAAFAATIEIAEHIKPIMAAKLKLPKRGVLIIISSPSSLSDSASSKFLSL